MWEVNPDFRLLVFLRNPIDRSYSQWKMSRFIKKYERLSFCEVVQQEILRIYDADAIEAFKSCKETEGISNWREGYVLKSIYADSLDSLYNYFPRSQILVLISEEVWDKPVSAYQKMFEFLGVEDLAMKFERHFSSPPTSPMPGGMRNMLAEFFRPSVNRLCERMGRRVSEWRDFTDADYSD